MKSCSRGAAAAVHPGGPGNDVGDEAVEGAALLGDELRSEQRSVEAIRASVAASGGMLPQLRFVLWPSLLGLVTPAVRSAQGMDDEASGRAREEELSALVAQVDRVDQSLVRTIDADVPRTDDLSDEQRSLLRSLLLAHCVHQPAWGYFQGMNDMASVVIRACESMRDDNAAVCETVASRAFWILRGVLAHCAENWSHTDLEGVWRQARAVRAVLRAADKKLAAKLEKLDGAHAADQPLAFLFGPIFLRLKRELSDAEQAMRLWEVSWANGRAFDVLIFAAFVRSQRVAIIRMREGPNASAALHQHFGRLHGTQRAAPLLEEARRLRSLPACTEALDEHLGMQPTQARQVL